MDTRSHDRNNIPAAMGQSDVRQNTNTEAHGKLFAGAHEWGRSLIQSERLCLGSQPGNHRDPKAKQPKGNQGKRNQPAQPGNRQGSDTKGQAGHDPHQPQPNQAKARERRVGKTLALALPFSVKGAAQDIVSIKITE